MIDFIIPDDVRTLYGAAAPLYRIHSTWNEGMEVQYRQKRVDRRWVEDLPSEFLVRWGMRPLGVSMGGWVGLTTGWTIRKKGWVFDGYGASFNYPGHTTQSAAFKWSARTPFARLLHWVTDEAIAEFLKGCPGLSCSHRDPAVPDEEVLTEGGFTTSGAPPLFHRVW